jgi:methionine aminotransferase
MQSKLPHTGTTIFSVMSALAAEHKAINLSQGFPDFPISDELKNLVKIALDENQVQYAPMPGRLDLRNQISNLTTAKHGFTPDPETEITITAGATQAIFTAIACLIQPGDEVIMFDPAYDCYDPSVLVFGAKPVHLKLRFPDFSVDWNELDKKINSKTRLLIFNNPHNPAGSVWTPEDLIQLEKILIKHKHLFVISDEVYEYIQFEGTHQSVLKNELIRSRSFVMYSFGKTLHVTGWKLGYCIAPAELTKEFRKIHQFNVFCVNNTMQYAVSKYLENKPDLESIASFYQKKRDLFLNAIRQSAFKPLNCSGTYFCLLDFSALSQTPDLDFAKKLTTDFGVAAIPISVFYEDKTDQSVLRFCFAKQDETLLNAAEKLCKI